GETSGTFERVTFATTTLRSPRGPSAVATKRPALAGLPALAAGATEYVKPASGANAWPPLPKAVAHCPPTAFWKFTTPGALATCEAVSAAGDAAGTSSTDGLPPVKQRRTKPPLGSPEASTTGASTPSVRRRSVPTSS